MNENKKTGQETAVEFFNSLPKEDASAKADIFGSPKEEPKEPIAPVEETEEVVEDSVKNRRHRRLEQKVDSYKDEIIQLNERVKVLSEVDKFAKETPEVDPDIARMFDTTDIGKENALRLSRKLTEIEDRAERKALARIEEIRQNEVKEVEAAGNQIDTELDNLEESFGVQFYGSKKADALRSEFLEFVEKISPKDGEGNITDYADFETSFEVFQATHTKEKPDNSRQREIASRGMQRSQTSAPVVKPRSAGWDGWKKDLGLE